MNNAVAKINIEVIDRYQKLIFYALVGSIAILSILYFYFINSIIFNVAAREDLEIKRTELAYDMSEREFALVNEKKKIDIELAHELGYKDDTKPQYFARGGQGSLSLNNE